MYSPWSLATKFLSVLPIPHMPRDPPISALLLALTSFQRQKFAICKMKTERIPVRSAICLTVMSPLQADLSLNVAHLEDKIKLRIMQD